MSSINAPPSPEINVHVVLKGRQHVMQIERRRIETAQAEHIDLAGIARQIDGLVKALFIALGQRGFQIAVLMRERLGQQLIVARGTGMFANLLCPFEQPRRSGRPGREPVDIDRAKIFVTGKPEITGQTQHRCRLQLRTRCHRAHGLQGHFLGEIEHVPRRLTQLRRHLLETHRNDLFQFVFRHRCDSVWETKRGAK
ncbi:hypothetical protein P8H29_11425 [Pandoraea communis]|nr:hypothetical protein [Pandoraea communis]MDM8356780.1 hypothetical protein [Pandoraea communis]